MFTYYCRLARKVGLPELKTIAVEKLPHVKALDKCMECAELYPFRDSASKLQEVYCGNWNKTKFGSLNDSIARHAIALCDGNKSMQSIVAETQNMIRDTQKREMFVQSNYYYNALARKCKLPPVSTQNCHYATTLDKIVFSATHYAIREHASPMLRQYCGNWKLSKPESHPIDLKWYVFLCTQHILEPLTNLSHEEKISIMDNCYNTILMIQENKSFGFLFLHQYL